MKRLKTHDSRAGFTLLELLITVAILGTTLMSIAISFKRASASYEEGRVDRELETQAYRALDFMAREFIDAGVGQIPAPPTAPLGADSITYRRATGFDGVNVLWGDFTTIELELEEGELDDAVDNNGNGLVDERIAVWIVNEGQPDERRRVITRWVRELLEDEIADGDDDNGNDLEDERGLSFELQGNVLIIRLTLERIGYQGRIVTTTARTSVQLRN